MGYQVWRHSRTLPLPAAVEIQRVDFGINVGGFALTEWYKLPLSTGINIVDLFRDSVVLQPRQGGEIIFTRICAHEYSLRILDQKRVEYRFSFRVYSDDVFAHGTWASDVFYVLPEGRMPLLKESVRHLLSTEVIAGGEYCYLPGEEDRNHFSRIRRLILEETTTGLKNMPSQSDRPQNVAIPNPKTDEGTDQTNKSPSPPTNGGPDKQK